MSLDGASMDDSGTDYGTPVLNGLAFRLQEAWSSHQEVRHAEARYENTGFPQEVQERETQDTQAEGFYSVIDDLHEQLEHQRQTRQRKSNARGYQQQPPHPFGVKESSPPPPPPLPPPPHSPSSSSSPSLLDQHSSVNVYGPLPPIIASTKEPVFRTIHPMKVVDVATTDPALCEDARDKYKAFQDRRKCSQLTGAAMDQQTTAMPSIFTPKTLGNGSLLSHRHFGKPRRFDYCILVLLLLTIAGVVAGFFLVSGVASGNSNSSDVPATPMSPTIPETSAELSPANITSAINAFRAQIAELQVAEAQSASALSALEEDLARQQNVSESLRIQLTQQGWVQQATEGALSALQSQTSDICLALGSANLIRSTVYAGGLNGTVVAINADGTRRWMFQAEGAARLAQLDRPEATAYFSSSDGQVYAVGANGALRWKHKLGHRVVLTSPALSADGKSIFVGTFFDDTETTTIIAIKATTGQLLWETSLGSAGRVGGSLVAGIDGATYVGTSNGSLFALAANGTLIWRFQTTGSIQARPAVRDNDGAVFVSTDNSLLYAIHGNGSLLFVSAIEGLLSESSPVLTPDGGLVFKGRDFLLGKINAANGALVWQTNTSTNSDSGYAAHSPTVASDGTAFVGSSSGDLVAFSNEGQQIWARSINADDRILSGPALSRDEATVLVGTGDGFVVAVSSGEGDVQWRHRVGEQIITAPTSVTGRACT